jgi:hypothetical protein
VFIHGGAYVAGYISMDFYQGQALALVGPAVVVTLQYRLGVLGYGRAGAGWSPFKPCLRAMRGGGGCFYCRRLPPLAAAAHELVSTPVCTGLLLVCCSCVQIRWVGPAALAKQQQLHG